MGIIISTIYSIIFLGVVSSVAHFPIGNTLIYYGLIGALILHVLNAAFSIYEKQNVTALLQFSVAIIFGSLFMNIIDFGPDLLTLIVGCFGCGTYLFLNRKNDKSRIRILAGLTLIVSLTLLVITRSELTIPTVPAIVFCFILAGFVLYSIYLKYLYRYPEGQAPKTRVISGNLIAIVGTIFLLMNTGIIPSLYSPNPKPEKAELERMNKEEKELLQKEIDKVHHLAGKITEK